jgi:hypothetical protein
VDNLSIREIFGNDAPIKEFETVLEFMQSKGFVFGRMQTKREMLGFMFLEKETIEIVHAVLESLIVKMDEGKDISNIMSN